MKIKDLDKKSSIENFKLNLLPLKQFSGSIPDTGYIVSMWEEGVWIKEQKEDTKVYPVFCEIPFEVILKIETIEE